MRVENPLPRPPREIYSMIAFLETQRKEMMNTGCIGGALAIGAQIQMVRWCYRLEDDEDEIENDVPKKKKEV